MVISTRQPLYHRGKCTRYPVHRRLGGAQSRCGGRDGQNLSPAQNRTLDSPIVQHIAQLLYWVSNWTPQRHEGYETVIVDRELMVSANTWRHGMGGRGDLWWRSTNTSNIARKVVWEKMMTSVKSESTAGDRNVTDEEQTARDVQYSIDWLTHHTHTHTHTHTHKHTHTHTPSNLQTHIKSHPTCFGETDVVFPIFVVTNTSSLYDKNTWRVVRTTDSAQCLVKTQALTPHCVLMPGRNYLLLQWDRFSRSTKRLRTSQPIYKYRLFSLVFSANG